MFDVLGPNEDPFHVASGRDFLHILILVLNLEYMCIQDPLVVVFTLS